ncbi:MAG: RAMP superfamily CRISPR-associated protein [Gammaproteobacteria bacterium]
MSPEYPVLYLARLVLETTTPLSISSGNREAAFDTLLVRDANDLPTIPGSSLAGVLRSLYAQQAAPWDVNCVFGFAEGDTGRPSRVQVSWGAIHDANDCPVEGLLLGDAMNRLNHDPVLASATATSPVLRDHVRMHHRGAGDHQGKFDRTALHRGHRFSVELSFWSSGGSDQQDDPDSKTWATILELLSHPGFRLGGRTRSGLGAVKLVRCHQTRFDLRKSGDYARYASLTTSLADTAGMQAFEPSPASPSLRCDLSLKPEEGWRFGQGNQSISEDADDTASAKSPNLLPVTEASVRWDKTPAYLEDQPRVLVPASGIKGALAHRLAFHHDCITENWATEQRCELDPQGDKAPPTHPAVAQLFGHAKTKESKDQTEEQKDRGRAGWVYLDDAYLDQPLDSRRGVQRQWHNGIDRFTGGVRKHVLYGEELIWRNTLQLTLRIDPRGHDLDANTKEALRRTLEDLTSGQLAIGGGSGKGHGYCQGTVKWSDNGAWIGAAS